MQGAIPSFVNDPKNLLAEVLGSYMEDGIPKSVSLA
jgi:hypothetical protein